MTRTQIKEIETLCEGLRKDIPKENNPDNKLKMEENLLEMELFLRDVKLTGYLRQYGKELSI